LLYSDFCKGRDTAGKWFLAAIHNEHHVFVANAMNRFSVGTKNKELKLNTDGSLTIYMQAEAPTICHNAPTGCTRSKATSRSTFAPAAKLQITEASWTPPAVKRAE
jgi:hypothetical protein